MEEKKRGVEVAAALQYQPEKNGAPVVVAAGKGAVAQKIVEIAGRENIPLYHDKELADTLYKLGCGVEIPPRLYEVVARILLFVGNLDKAVSPGDK